MIHVSVKTKGKSTVKFLEKMKERRYLNMLNKYGQIGVEALSSATPFKTGKTSDSWYYTIEQSSGSVSIHWSNSNTNKGVNIAVILDTGHGTGTGGYVQGRNYISPAIQPIFDKIARDAWTEVIES